MALKHDEEIFAKFREIAVTELSDIEIGMKLYSNAPWTPEFVVADLISSSELDKRHNFSPEQIYERMPMAGKTYTNDIAWIITKSGDTISLRDRNVGASYNPWLLFKNKHDRDQCVHELENYVCR